MTRKKWLTALVAVLLIGAGIAGGFKIHETFFGGQTYSLAMATASAEGDALLARTGIPARIALIAISVGIRPLE